MPRFTVRVELHQAHESDYERLHEEMEDEGFRRTITDSKGVTFKLPTAEYNLEGEFTTDQANERAAAAAQRTGKRFWILVTASNGRRWTGLPEAD